MIFYLFPNPKNSIENIFSIAYRMAKNIPAYRMNETISRVGPVIPAAFATYVEHASAMRIAQRIPAKNTIHFFTVEASMNNLGRVTIKR